MYKGGCLCGLVQYEITGSIYDIVCCHCSLCRKAQGSAFAVNGNVLSSEFRLLRGKDQLTAYQNNPHQKKYFCSQCGSPIFSQNDKNQQYTRIRLGTLDTKIRERPKAHIFYNSKADWEENLDELSKYEEYND